MLLDSRSPGSERPLKRAREPEESDPERAPASKRHRLPTPSTPNNRFLESPSIIPGPPEAASPVTPPLEGVGRDCAPVSKRPIHKWLETVPPPLHRRNSAPAQLTSQGALATINTDNDQQSSFAPFHDIPRSPGLEMPQSQGQSGADASVTSGQSSRPSTSSAIYRSVLRNNRVHMDHTGDKIPPELRKFVDAEILERRSSQLSPERLTETVNTAVDIADSAEGNIYDLIGTAMFPVKRRDVGRGGNTPWSTDPLPRNSRYPQPLAAPKPDVHIGYPTDMKSTWTVKENAVTDHRVARPYTRPARGNAFPFLVFEMKSEATGGTLWQAENQAAGSGAHCVNSMRWLLREANRSETPSILDTVAFSIATTHRQAIYHVHFYTEEDEVNYMSWIGTFSTLHAADIQKSSDVIENILDHGLETRQPKIRSALGKIWPSLERWKPSRPASALDSPADSALHLGAEGSSSNKSVRLE
ncbi:MAG: hypothetical protein LQ338_007838 [Usnochroma carphineum]|nr:MAG: hypothetical protein LQ338_007838 [Usnochroma carphineum]